MTCNFFLSIPLNKLPWDISSGHTLFKTMQQSKKSEKMCLIPGKCIVSAMVPLQMVTKVRGKTIVLHSNVLCAADDSPRPLKLFFDKGCFFSESIYVFIISPNRLTNFLPQLEPLELRYYHVNKKGITCCCCCTSFFC